MALKRKLKVSSRKKEREVPLRKRSLTLDSAPDTLKINKNELDEELIEHSPTMQKIGEECVFAQSARDRAKDELERVEAEVYQEKKDAYSKKGTKEKAPTDYAIKAEVRSDSRVVKAYDVYRTAKMEASQWEIMQESFRQRGFMVNKLAELYIAQYYSKDSSNEYQRPPVDRKGIGRGRR